MLVQDWILGMSVLQRGFVPVEKALDTFSDFYLVGPTKAVELLHVNELAHSAIGLAGIKLNFAFKAYCLDNQLGELTDGEFLASADIDVTVANLSQTGDVATTTGGVVAINGSIGAGTIMYAGVFLYAYDVAEVDIQEHMDGGICHILAPEELTEGGAGAPENDPVVIDSVFG